MFNISFVLLYTEMAHESGVGVGAGETSNSTALVAVSSSLSSSTALVPPNNADHAFQHQIIQVNIYIVQYHTLYNCTSHFT